MAERKPPQRPSDASGATDDVLAGAEEAAAREAVVEAQGGGDAAAEAAGADPADGSGPRIVKPRARTSRQPKPAGGVEPASTAAGPGDGPGVAVMAIEPPDSVRAETVHVSRAGIQLVDARSVEVRLGGIGRAQATDVAVSQGGVGFARADRVSVEMGAIGAAFGSDVRITQGAASSILARDVRLEQSLVRVIVANEVHAERTTGVLVLLARRVEGDVRTVLDWRGALAFGAAFGAIVALFRRRGR